MNANPNPTSDTNAPGSSTTGTQPQVIVQQSKKNNNVRALVLLVFLAAALYYYFNNSAGVSTDAKKILDAQVRNESGNNMQLMNFRKVDGQKREVNGVRTYLLDYEAEIFIHEEGVWLTHDLLNQSHDGLTFTMARRSGNIFNQINQDAAGAVRVSGGEMKKIAGIMIGQKKESGWKFESGPSHIVSN
jgi:hypothetical protein